MSSNSLKISNQDFYINDDGRAIVRESFTRYYSYKAGSRVRNNNKIVSRAQRINEVESFNIATFHSMTKEINTKQFFKK